MSTDLMMLTLTAGLTAILWVPYILQRVRELGLITAVSYTADDKSIAPWAERAKRAHYNAVENLAPFAALVLVAHATGAANAATAAAATVYFWIRVIHYVVHIWGIPYARTIAFTIGWLAMACIFYQIVT